MNRDNRPLMERALEYVRLLAVGSEIVDEVDGPVIADYRHLIHVLLYKRGLYLEATARGMIVTDRAPWGRQLAYLYPQPQPITCQVCKRSWFDERCEHGLSTVVVVSEVYEGLVLPLQRTTVRAVG